MINEHYAIHEVAKEVDVETHVLRYWEEELELPILRNEKGHRVYTKDDIRRFSKIKKLRDQGLQLKAVRHVLNQTHEKETEECCENAEYSILQRQAMKNSRYNDAKTLQLRPVYGMKNEIKMKDDAQIQDFQQEKLARMQFLFQKLIKDVVEENNITLVHELSENIKGDILKELDYQFRLYEEQEEERERNRIEREEKYIASRRLEEEAHYKYIDELLRQAKDKAKSPKWKKLLGFQITEKKEQEDELLM